MKTWGEYLYDFWVNKCVLNRFKNVLTIKENTTKLGCIKIRNFCLLKEILRK